MRATMLVVVAALSMAATGAVPANAAPMMLNDITKASPNIVQVWGGCGWGFHPTYWAGCVPNRPHYYRPYWRYRHYGYYRPYWRYRYWHRRWGR